MTTNGRGRMMYIPKDTVGLLMKVKERDKLPKNKPAWERVTFLAGVGMNVEDALGIKQLFGNPVYKRKNKKGNVRDVIFLAVILFAVAMMYFVGNFTFNTLSDKLLNVSIINDSNASKQAIQATKDNTAKFDWVALAFLIGLVLSLMITGWFIGGYPVFMIFYFLGLVIAVVVSMVLGNAWESVVNHTLFGATINNLPITNHLITYLPVYVAIAGFLGMVAMFAKPYFGGGNDAF